MEDDGGPLLTDEEREVDVCVLGTGLTESLLAAALARHEFRVLHLDYAAQYGGNWRALNLADLERWASESVPDSETFRAREPDPSSVEGLRREPLGIGSSKRSSCFQHRSFAWDPFNSWAAEELESVQKELGKSPNAFSIDLVPRLLFGRSDLVDLLIESGVARYLEFQGLRAAKVLTTSGLATVPITKSEIFQDPVLSLPEKRTLMRFITSMMPFVGSLAFESPAQLGVDRVRNLSAPIEPSAANLGNVDLAAPWSSFLEQQRLSARLQDFLTYAICLWDGASASVSSEQQSQGSSQPGLTVAEGLKSLGRFVSSLGMHGQGMPLLYPMYGAAEVAQGFTRMCALHRGVYALRTSVTEVLLEEKLAEPAEEAKAGATSAPSWRVAGLVTHRGEVIRARAIVSARDQLLPECDGASASSRASGAPRACSRMTVLTDCPLLGAEGLNFCVVPPSGAEPELRAVVQALQLDFSTGTCPRGYTVLQLSQLCIGDSDTEEEHYKDIERVLTKLLDLAGGEQHCICRCSYLHRPGAGDLPADSILRDCLTEGSLTLCEDPSTIPQLLAEREPVEAQKVFLANPLHGATPPEPEAFLRKPTHVAMEERGSAMEELANFNEQMLAGSGEGGATVWPGEASVTGPERAAGA